MLAFATVVVSLATPESAPNSLQQPPNAQVFESDEHDPLRHIKGQPTIIFGVLTGGAMMERSQGVLDTWCSDIDACFFCSDFDNTTWAHHPDTFAYDMKPWYPMYDFITEEKQVAYAVAQARFMLCVREMKRLVVAPPAGDQRFDKLEWVAQVDDDTYVFYHNLKLELSRHDPQDKIYTGQVAPDFWLPVHQDGFGRELAIAAPDPFVLGGSGSIFSVGMIRELDLDWCINASMPGGLWERWQSDWMLGACAKRQGWDPVPGSPGKYVQFACTSDEYHIQPCKDDPAPLDLAIYNSTFNDPAVVHPVSTHGAVLYLRETYPNSATQPVGNLSMKMLAREEMSGLKGQQVLYKLKADPIQ